MECSTFCSIFGHKERHDRTDYDTQCSRHRRQFCEKLVHHEPLLCPEPTDRLSFLILNRLSRVMSLTLTISAMWFCNQLVEIGGDPLPLSSLKWASFQKNMVCRSKIMIFLWQQVEQISNFVGSPKLITQGCHDASCYDPKLIPKS